MREYGAELKKVLGMAGREAASLLGGRRRLQRSPREACRQFGSPTSGTRPAPEPTEAPTFSITRTRTHRLPLDTPLGRADMPYNDKTGIYTSIYGSIPLPEQAQTIYDFLFESSPQQQVVDPRGRTWLLDAHSNRSYTFEQARERADDIARALHEKRDLREGDSLVIFAPNDLDYGPALWGAFRQGAVVSCANPAYNADEFAHQLRTVHSHHPIKAILVHPDAAVATVQACEKSGISSKSVILLKKAGATSTNVMGLAEGLVTLDELVATTRSASMPAKCMVKQGEKKTKLAVSYCAQPCTKRLPD